MSVIQDINEQTEGGCQDDTNATKGEANADTQQHVSLKSIRTLSS